MTTASIPPGAVDFDEWEDDDGTPYCFFSGAISTVEIPERTVRGHLFTTAVEAHVWVQGNEWADGHIERQVCIAGLHQDEPLTVADARRVLDMLAAVVAAETAEVDRLGS
jgi:hypothetical protein